MDVELDAKKIELLVKRLAADLHHHYQGVVDDQMPLLILCDKRSTLFGTDLLLNLTFSNHFQVVELEPLHGLKNTIADRHVLVVGIVECDVLEGVKKEGAKQVMGCWLVGEKEGMGQRGWTGIGMGQKYRQAQLEGYGYTLQGKGISQSQLRIKIKSK